MLSSPPGMGDHFISLLRANPNPSRNVFRGEDSPVQSCGQASTQSSPRHVESHPKLPASRGKPQVRPDSEQQPRPV